MSFTQIVGRGTRTGYAHRKYAPGPLLTTIDQVLDCAKRRSWIWVVPLNKAQHPSWIVSQQASWLARFLEQGRYRLAIRNKTVPLVFRSVWCESMEPNHPSAWWLSCDEIPLWGGHYAVKEGWIIQYCNHHARSLGHFGPVRVQFEKQMP